MRRPFVSTAPGRLCLFGEHQDYLGLPVIAMAMNRRCSLHFTPVNDHPIAVESRDMGRIGTFDPNNALPAHEAHPLEHALHRLLAELGPLSEGGWHIEIESDIPIRAGCSSSTALLTAWIAGWLHILRGGYETSDVVRRCTQYEVLDVGGAGGDMDQFACGHGGLHRFGVGEPQALHLPNGVFVLGDSGEPKDTQGHLRRCREARLPLMPLLDDPDVTLDADERVLLQGTRINRDLEAKWARNMAEGIPDGPSMGADLSRHHAVLRDVLGLSTPRIEGMLNAAIDAGAWGGKINGSGGGGCVFALCSEDKAEAVVHAMVRAGAKGAGVVQLESGVQCRH